MKGCTLSYPNQNGSILGPVNTSGVLGVMELVSGFLTCFLRFMLCFFVSLSNCFVVLCFSVSTNLKLFMEICELPANKRVHCNKTVFLRGARRISVKCFRTSHSDVGHYRHPSSGVNVDHSSLVNRRCTLLLCRFGWGYQVLSPHLRWVAKYQVSRRR